MNTWGGAWESGRGSIFSCGSEGDPGRDQESFFLGGWAIVRRWFHGERPSWRKVFGSSGFGEADFGKIL